MSEERIELYVWIEHLEGAVEKEIGGRQFAVVTHSRKKVRATQTFIYI
jgi:hypothetical protein